MMNFFADWFSLLENEEFFERACLWYSLSVFVLFPVFLFKTAHYGRFFAGKAWFGLVVSDWIAWIFFELVSPLCFFSSLLHDRTIWEVLANPLALMWFVHYFQRSIIYPLLFRASNKKTPLEMAIFPIFFNFFNGTLNGKAAALINDRWSLELLTSPYFLIGFFLYIFGGWINVHSDHVLRQLRKPHETVYRIPPPKGFHRYVASPNYFGESVEWIGYTICARGSLAAIGFVCWTVVHLGMRAVANRKWYVERFGDKYPKERKAFIPYIF